MPVFKVHDQRIEAPTIYAAYAIRFGVTLAEAIADRDLPLTTEDCAREFFHGCGRQPTDAEMAVMHPESVSAVLNHIRDYQREA